MRSTCISDGSNPKTQKCPCVRTGFCLHLHAPDVVTCMRLEPRQEPKRTCRRERLEERRTSRAGRYGMKRVKSGAGPPDDDAILISSSISWPRRRPESGRRRDAEPPLADAMYPSIHPSIRVCPLLCFASGWGLTGVPSPHPSSASLDVVRCSTLMHC